jgi:hypothetical protein
MEHRLRPVMLLLQTSWILPSAADEGPHAESTGREELHGANARKVCSLIAVSAHVDKASLASAAPLASRIVSTMS